VASLCGSARTVAPRRLAAQSQAARDQLARRESQTATSSRFVSGGYNVRVAGHALLLRPNRGKPGAAGNRRGLGQSEPGSLWTKPYKFGQNRTDGGKDREPQDAERGEKVA
jgi:hypothetical protein